MRVAVALVALASLGCNETPTCGASADPGAVTVAMCDDNGHPLVGYRIYFQNQDSTIVAISDTDAHGVASAAMAPGGFVTAVGIQALFTVVDPQNGDVLPFTFESHTEKSVDFAIPVPSDELGNYDLTTSTTSGVQPSDEQPVPQVHSVRTADKASFLVASRDRGRMLVARSVAVTPHIDLTSFSFAPAVPLTLNVPSDIPSPEGTANCSASVKVVTSEGGIVVPGPLPGQQPMFAPGSDDTLAIWKTCRVQDFIDWGPYAPDYTRDLTIHVPFVPLDPVPQGTWSFDVDQQVATWREDGGDVPPEFSRVTLTVIRQVTDPVDHEPVDIQWLWAVVTAHTGTSVSFPRLPTDDANAIKVDRVGVVGLNPKASDAVHAEFRIGAGLPWDVVRTSSYLTYGIYGLLATRPTGSLNITYGGS